MLHDSHNHFALSQKLYMKQKFTGIQDCWGLDVCNGFGGFGGALNPKVASVFVIWSGLAATGHRFFSFS